VSVSFLFAEVVNAPPDRMGPRTLSLPQSPRTHSSLARPPSSRMITEVLGWITLVTGLRFPCGLMQLQVRLRFPSTYYCFRPF